MQDYDGCFFCKTQVRLREIELSIQNKMAGLGAEGDPNTIKLDFTILYGRIRHLCSLKNLYVKIYPENKVKESRLTTYRKVFVVVLIAALLLYLMKILEEMNDRR